MLPKTKHRHIANKNKYSCDLAILDVSGGIIYLDIANNDHHIKIILAVIVAIIVNEDQLVFVLNAAKNINNNIAMMSCTISIQIESLQNILSISS
jgi:hypothetical protein